MGFLQKRPITESIAPLYTVSSNKTVLIVGLGNIGKEYDGTRHNVGFAAIDYFIEQAGLAGWSEKKDLKCLLTSGNLGASRVIAIKPTTFMNASGDAVQAVSHFYKIQPADIIVVHDELDVPFGQIRLRVGGASAGHNGIKSVTQQIGENYGRVRIGVGPKKPIQIDSADFVLAHFTKAQQADMANLNSEVNAILHESIFGGSLPHETRSFLF